MQQKCHLRIDNSTEVLESQEFVWFITESVLYHFKEVLYALYEGFLEQHASLIIDFGIVVKLLYC